MWFNAVQRRFYVVKRGSAWFKGVWIWFRINGTPFIEVEVLICKVFSLLFSHSLFQILCFRVPFDYRTGTVLTSRFSEPVDKR